MMKNFLRSVFFFGLTVVLSFCSLWKDISDSLYNKQKQQSKAVADATKWVRILAIKNKVFNKVDIKDTIWIIERVDEVDKSVKTYMWDQKRTKVIKYGNYMSYEFITIPYSKFDDPLKIITEEFDSLSIKNKTSYLGAYRVFISRIINKDVQTFYFSDVTPLQYFKDE
jgi:hypothetical protein